MNPVGSNVDILMLSTNADLFGKVNPDGSFKASNRFNVTVSEVRERKRFTELIIDHVRDRDMNTLSMRTIRNIKPLKFDYKGEGHYSIRDYQSNNLKLMDAYLILSAVDG